MTRPSPPACFRARSLAAPFRGVAGGGWESEPFGTDPSLVRPGGGSPETASLEPSRSAPAQHLAKSVAFTTHPDEAAHQGLWALS
jgi:hypothetical protein